MSRFAGTGVAMRLNKTTIDYLVTAIIPALIMLLVGSLVFFLLALFYHGQYAARLNFIFAMFVMATVLVARISMEEGIEYATLFALPLALAAGLAMLRFVEIRGPLAPLSPLINCGLLAVVWWSAHRLTWDCTLIDERQDASGEGLLQTMGLDRGCRTGQNANGCAEQDAEQADVEQADVEQHPEEEEKKQRREQEGEQKQEQEQEDQQSTPPQGLSWQRLRRHLARWSTRRPHSPGVWVVYFSLAALPLFGLGQRLLPATDLAGRQYAFRLLVVYVISGLGLLLTTSLLGLRRYLRQRQVQMSTDMAGAWLITGGVMIAVLVVACALLPRPAAEYAVSSLPLSFAAPDGLRSGRISPGSRGPDDRRHAACTQPEQDRGVPAAASSRRRRRTPARPPTSSAAGGKTERRARPTAAATRRPS